MSHDIVDIQSFLTCCLANGLRDGRIR